VNQSPQGERGDQTQQPQNNQQYRNKLKHGNSR
jgi:hypothetical protein